jgi:hypothetical protein
MIGTHSAGGRLEGSFSRKSEDLGRFVPVPSAFESCFL